jgi:pyruvate/2-oxoglutarate dehydrogenase complex dihydrolipoamide acyltransferase (E2) component
VLAGWQVSVGDDVIAPRVNVVIETSSFVMELGAFDKGVLAELCFAVGDVIPDGSVVARISLAGKMG